MTMGSSLPFKEKGSSTSQLEQVVYKNWLFGEVQKGLLGLKSFHHTTLLLDISAAPKQNENELDTFQAMNPSPLEVAHTKL